MKTVAGLVLTVVIAAIGTAPALAADKPRDLIVGKWKPDDYSTFEFTKDGDVKVHVKGKGVDLTRNGKYKFVDDETIEVTMDNDMKAEKFTVLTISKDEMEWRLKNGKVVKLNKVKE
jgi:uncharacterized protein (TIGR03066 family)